MCCLFGLIDYKRTLTGKQKNKFISILSEECEARGTDAAGVAYNRGGILYVYKRPLPAHKLKFNIPSESQVVMGHTRMTTQGNEKYNFNNHPFVGHTENGKFALAHNGVLHNDALLRKTLNLSKTYIQTDSYIAVQLIEQKRTLNMSSLKYMAEQVEGSFSFTVLDSMDNVYFVKGDNPLCIYRYSKTGIIVYASTEEILKKAVRRFNFSLGGFKRIEINCGDILKSDCHGNITKSEFDTYGLIQNWYLSNWRGELFENGYGGLKKAYDDYINDIKSVAGHFGYSSEDVDLLLEEGFSPEELEEYFYYEKYRAD